MDENLINLPSEIIELIADLLPGKDVISLTSINKQINTYLKYKIYKLKTECYDQRCYYFNELVKYCENCAASDNSINEYFRWNCEKSKTIKCSFSGSHKLTVIYSYTRRIGFQLRLYLDGKGLITC